MHNELEPSTAFLPDPQNVNCSAKNELIPNPTLPGSKPAPPTLREEEEQELCTTQPLR